MTVFIPQPAEINMFDTVYGHVESALSNAVSHLWLSLSLLLTILYISWTYSHRNRVCNSPQTI